LRSGAVDNKDSTWRRWRLASLRRVLRPASRPSLDRWIAEAAGQLKGLVLVVGSGGDRRTFGRRTVHLDRYAPAVDVRADLRLPLPFREGSFDAALCTEVLEHVPDAQLLLSEIRRVLSPGGVAVITVPFVFHYHRDPEDYRRYSPDGLRRDLERAGFVVEMIAGSGGKIVAAALLVESVHPVAKVAVRICLLPFAPLMSRRRPRPGYWSDWAANVVAVASVPLG
jgi:SAM-dependent methyltransferase